MTTRLPLPYPALWSQSYNTTTGGLLFAAHRFCLEEINAANTIQHERNGICHNH